MAICGGAGVGLGLGALFATQIYSAAASGGYVAIGWSIALLVTLLVLNIEPIDRVAVAFVVGEGTGLLMLGLVLPRWARNDVV